MEIVCNPDPSRWDLYTAGHPLALYSHLGGWSGALSRTYALDCFHLLARSSREPEKAAGALPLLLFSPPRSQKRLISLPYTDAAGVVADSPEVWAGLIDRALTLADELGAAHLEIRQYPGAGWMETCRPERQSWTFRAHDFKVGLCRALPETREALWQGLSAKVRNQVRKALRCGCEGRVGGIELFDDFYAVFSENMRDLGSPVHAPGLFPALLAPCPEWARLFVIYRRGLPAAGAMVFRKGDTLFNPWAASLRRLRPFCPNMLLYWEMLAHGVAAGCRRFDFGRSSPGAPTCRFKLQWGAVMRPLVWYVFSKSSHVWHPEMESLTDENWRGLDLSESRVKGPGIRRWISL